MTPILSKYVFPSSVFVSLKFKSHCENISLTHSFRLLNRTRDIVKDIKENSEYDPGFIENGGIFIARNQVFTLTVSN